MDTTFTPIASLIGGSLIGLAAVLLMASVGRIFGATGILAGLIKPADFSDWLWRATLVLGMLCGPVLMLLVNGEMPQLQIPSSPVQLAIGGFIVGIGVTFGSGCTSGHGVCGIARVSPRSIVATLVFMLTTAITVYLLRHVLGA